MQPFNKQNTVGYTEAELERMNEIAAIRTMFLAYGSDEYHEAIRQLADEFARDPAMYAEPWTASLKEERK